MLESATTHRPMSLLLQALKQIETKVPIETPPAASAVAESAVESLTMPCAAEPANTAKSAAPDSSERLLLSRPVIIGLASAQPLPMVTGQAIHLIRHYHESETATEIAVAEPVVLEPAAPPSASDDQPSSAAVEPAGEPSWLARRQRHWLAEQIVGLLPDESRAVIAILPADDQEVSPIVLEICEGLAARRTGEVLAIAQVGPGVLPEWPEIATFNEIVAGRAAWSDAVARGSDDQFAVMARGGLPSFGNVPRRRLLKLWQEMGDRFAYVVLDATADNFEDVVPLLATCDATFLAVRLNETNRHDAERLLAVIRQAGCQPNGCVVTDG